MSGHEIFLGIIIGALTVVAAVEYRDAKSDGWRGMKEACEKSIPRDQQCKMQWVPAKATPQGAADHGR